LVITVSAPDKEGIKVPTEDEIIASYRKIENSDIEAYMDVDSDKPLLTKLPTAGTIKSKKEIKEIGATELVLSNGIKVILKPTDFKNDEINMSSFAWGGNSTVADADYYSAAAASSIVNQSGLGDFDQTSLIKKMTGKQVSVYSYISELTQGMGGSSTVKDLETFFQMLYLEFTAPRRDEDAFKSVKSKMLDQVMNSGLDPNSVFRDTINAVMGGQNFRRMPWTEESIEQINLDKAYNFYKQKFANAGGFTFTFVGSFKVEDLENYIKLYVASLPTGNSDKWKDVGIKAPTNAFKKVVNKGFEPKSSVRLVINGDFEFKRENRFAISALIEVLNIRLREVIREDKGGVYGIYARPNFTQYPKSGYTINVGFGTGPDRAEELISAAKDVIAEVKAGKFDETYIEKVQAILNREYETNKMENNYWLSVINQYLTYSEPLTQINDYPNFVKKISKDYIVSAANKYLNMDSFKEFILMPEE